MDWCEKYRPKDLSQILTNSEAVRELRSFADAWKRGNPARKALVLEGGPGTGKTTSALGLAYEYGWGVIELNASDTRTAELIKKIVTEGSLNQTFTDDGSYLSTRSGGLKLIILDEADNIAGKEEEGGLREIVNMLRLTKQPVILIVNDLYGLTRTAPSIKNLVTVIKFKAVHVKSIAKRLMDIAKAEGISLNPAAAEKLAKKSGGDMRSAINDLQCLSIGSTVIKESDVDVLGDRDERSTMFDTLPAIFFTNSIHHSKEVLSQLDEPPDRVALWIDENLPYAYPEIKDIAQAYRWLVKADVFLGRAKRDQNYRYWAYAYDFMGPGVTAAKQTQYRHFIKFKFPSWLSRMSQYKDRRRNIHTITQKLMGFLHADYFTIWEEIIAPLRPLLQRDEKLAVDLCTQADLDDSEIIQMLQMNDDNEFLRSVLKKMAQIRAMKRDEKIVSKKAKRIEKTEEYPERGKRDVSANSQRKKEMTALPPAISKGIKENEKDKRMPGEDEDSDIPSEEVAADDADILALRRRKGGRKQKGRVKSVYQDDEEEMKEGMNAGADDEEGVEESTKKESTGALKTEVPDGVKVKPIEAEKPQSEGAGVGKETASGQSKDNKDDVKTSKEKKVQHTLFNF